MDNWEGSWGAWVLVLSSEPSQGSVLNFPETELIWSDFICLQERNKTKAYARKILSLLIDDRNDKGISQGKTHINHEIKDVCRLEATHGLSSYSLGPVLDWQASFCTCAETESTRGQASDSNRHKEQNKQLLHCDVEVAVASELGQSWASHIKWWKGLCVLLGYMI